MNCTVHNKESFAFLTETAKGKSWSSWVWVLFRFAPFLLRLFSDTKLFPQKIATYRSFLISVLSFFLDFRSTFISWVRWTNTDPLRYSLCHFKPYTKTLGNHCSLLPVRKVITNKFEKIPVKTICAKFDSEWFKVSDDLNKSINNVLLKFLSSKIFFLSLLVNSEPAWFLYFFLHHVN